MITGGDFHVILDADLDGSGRKPQVKEILWKNRGLDCYLAVKKSSGWRQKLTQQYNTVWTFRLISGSKRE